MLVTLDQDLGVGARAGQTLGFGYLCASHPRLCDTFAILRRPKSRPGGRGKVDLRWWRCVGSKGALATQSRARLVGRTLFATNTPISTLVRSPPRKGTTLRAMTACKSNWVRSASCAVPPT